MTDKGKKASRSEMEADVHRLVISMYYGGTRHYEIEALLGISARYHLKKAGVTEKPADLHRRLKAAQIAKNIEEMTYAREHYRMGCAKWVVRSEAYSPIDFRNHMTPADMWEVIIRENTPWE